jgi:hypothetical protein
MHVHRESRSIALEKYWLRVRNEEVNDDVTRIDPAEDTIFIPWLILGCGGIFIYRLINVTAWSEEARNAVRSMAVDDRIWRTDWALESYLFRELGEIYSVGSRIVRHRLGGVAEA